MLSRRTQAFQKQPRAKIPAVGTRVLINQVIHQAICQTMLAVSGEPSTGVGLCAYYATVTMLVMGVLTGRRYLLQAGNIHLQLSEKYRHRNPLGSTHLSMISDPLIEGGPSRARLPFPEFHAWVGAIHLTAEEQLSSSEHADRRPAYELIDLSARHYRTHVHALDPDWEEPEDFANHPLWTTADQLPSWLLLEPVEQTTRDVAQMMSEPPRCKIAIRATRAALSSLAHAGLTKGSLNNQPPEGPSAGDLLAVSQSPRRDGGSGRIETR